MTENKPPQSPTQTTKHQENTLSKSSITPDELTTNVTHGAAEFVAKLEFPDIPQKVLTIAQRCILDTSGLYVAGLTEESTQIIMDMSRADGGSNESLLLGAGEVRVPTQVAARVLGIAAHAHDFDDTQVSHDPAHVYGLLTHPSTAPLSAALSVADMRGDVSGEEFMTAFLGGYEVSCKVSEWMKPEHYLRGHHSSGTVATFGAAMAAGKLLKLSQEQLAYALGIAASMAAGIRCSFGTMCKPWHVGRAAENGVMAAKMAQRGFTGDPAALDGHWGFAQILAGGFSTEKLQQGFGNTWSMLDPGVSIKPYPSGILTHQAMDMVRNLVIREDIQPEDVVNIAFYAGDNILNPIRYPIAANGLQAKFSMAALISMVVLYRAAGLAQFEDTVVMSPIFQSMQKRVKCKVDPEINAQGFDLIRSRVAIRLSDGRCLEADGDTRYRGGPQLPFTRADLVEKVSACCHYLPDAQIEGLIAAVDMLPEQGPEALLTQLKALPEVAPR